MSCRPNRFPSVGDVVEGGQGVPGEVNPENLAARDAAIAAAALAGANAANAADSANEAAQERTGAEAARNQAQAQVPLAAAQVTLAAGQVALAAQQVTLAAAQTAQAQTARSGSETAAAAARGYRDQAQSIAASQAPEFLTLTELLDQTDQAVLAAYVIADGTKNGRYVRTSAAAPWVKRSKDTVPAIAARTLKLEARITDAIGSKWSGLDTDPHGRLRFGFSNDVIAVPNARLVHERGAIELRGPGSALAFKAALAAQGQWFDGQLDAHNRLLWGIRRGRFYSPPLDILSERGAIELRGPGGALALKAALAAQGQWLDGQLDTHNRLLWGIRKGRFYSPPLDILAERGGVEIRAHAGAPVTHLVRAHAPGWVYAYLDLHNAVIHGLRTNGTFYPPLGLTGAGQAAPPPVTLNRHAMRWLAARRWQRSIGQAVKASIGVIGDSFSANGIRFWRQTIEGAGPGSIIGRLGDGGAGWVSFVTGSARSGTGRYIMRRQSPTAGAGVGGMQTDDDYWDVSRRDPGNAGPDISQVTPLAPADASGGTFTLTAPVDSVPLSSVTLHYLASASCTIRYRWSGGMWIYLMLATTGGPSAVDLNNVPTAPGWTLDIEAVTGSTPLYGLYLDSPNSGANVSVFGVNGSATTDWINNDAASWQQGIALLPIKTWIILLGTNDQGLGNSPAIFIAAVHQIVTRLRAVDPGCDICFWLPSDNYNPALSGHPMSEYEAVLRAYALANPSVTVLFSQTFFGAARAADGQPGAYGSSSAFPAWDADLSHPSNVLGAAVQSQGLMSELFS